MAFTEPVFVEVPSNQAVLVASEIEVGQIRKVKSGSPGSAFFYTYVPKDAPAPAESDFRGGRISWENDIVAIVSPIEIDVYLWLTGDESGEVRIEKWNI